jgi:hypothetical protein
MTQQHPITPPQHLIDQWMQYHSTKYALARQAAQWGADQELDACCQALYDRYDSVRRATGFPGNDMSDWLRAARRPKPPSLKEQALVERVATTLRQVQTDSPWIPRWKPEARAAIREVAAWLREAHGWEQGAQGLEREAER